MQGNNASIWSAVGHSLTCAQEKEENKVQVKSHPGELHDLPIEDNKSNAKTTSPPQTKTNKPQNDQKEIYTSKFLLFYFQLSILRMLFIYLFYKKCVALIY